MNSLSQYGCTSLSWYASHEYRVRIKQASNGDSDIARLCDHIGENNARVVYCLSGSLLRLVRNAARSRIDNCSAKQ
ncbi:hypothetical protein DMW23_23775 [Vibrio parahaemolyticus]|nr:hypothetical protein [Vibrio parahaemolyticus]EGR2835062.1 hypothetical protein [Vibrio parahaemolyticus]EGR2887564.1 hypothetical protein [Vibrio parahaemolyticus]EGR2908863.1 hypothetical protein [Vibrio parahaemolyticus]EGR2942581.1 hypothetical protein [Vibrio parahaemolyticus]